MCSGFDSHRVLNMKKVPKLLLLIAILLGASGLFVFMFSFTFFFEIPFVFELPIRTLSDFLEYLVGLLLAIGAWGLYRMRLWGLYLTSFLLVATLVSTILTLITYGVSIPANFTGIMPLFLTASSFLPFDIFKLSDTVFGIIFLGVPSLVHIAFLWYLYSIRKQFK